jgi:hypothetical protein
MKSHSGGSNLFVPQFFPPDIKMIPPGPRVTMAAIEGRK